MTTDSGRIPEGEEDLREGLSVLGFDPGTLAPRLLAFCGFVLKENARTNLVGAKDLPTLIVRHVLDSMAPWRTHGPGSPAIDVGSGAGFPGIPLAMAFPQVEFLLLEPRAKRFSFLDLAVARFGLKNVEARKTAAETAARSSLRECAACVLVRAVARPIVALEYAVPLARLHGEIAFYMGRESVPDGRVQALAKQLGAEFLEATEVRVPYLAAQRHMWRFIKRQPTPPDLPRRSGMARRDPLGITT